MAVGSLPDETDSSTQVHMMLGVNTWLGHLQ